MPKSNNKERKRKTGAPKAEESPVREATSQRKQDPPATPRPLESGIKAILTAIPTDPLDFLLEELSPDHNSEHEFTLLRAKAHWLLADWETLAAIDPRVLKTHPDRACLALLVASAHQQLGNHNKAVEHVRRSMDWGCTRPDVAKYLLAGLHNTLARAFALCGNGTRSEHHFAAAIRNVSNTTDQQPILHGRSVRELIRLGLLPQALDRTDKLLQHLKHSRYNAGLSSAHTSVLDIEIDWLRSEILRLRKTKHLERSNPVSAQGGILRRSTDPKPHSSSDPRVQNRQYYGLHQLDRKLEAYIPYDDGFFIELGAHDGVTQSNTLYFERYRNWRGILIEPILHNFLECESVRSSENKYYCRACVSFTYDKQYVSLLYSNLMTTPCGLESDIGDSATHARSGSIYLPRSSDPIEVQAVPMTLTAIMNDAGAPPVIDFLSLDVEGAEMEVFKGIDHSRYRFKYILVESRNPPKLTDYLARHGYILIDKLSHHDLLFGSSALGP